jgi:hypothetical protein
MMMMMIMMMIMMMMMSISPVDPVVGCGRPFSAGGQDVITSID